MELVDKKNDVNSRILLFQVKIDSDVLVSIYKNTEPYQISTL